MRGILGSSGDEDGAIKISRAKYSKQILLHSLFGSFPRLCCSSHRSSRIIYTFCAASWAAEDPGQRGVVYTWPSTEMLLRRQRRCRDKDVDEPGHGCTDRDNGARRGIVAMACDPGLFLVAGTELLPPMPSSRRVRLPTLAGGWTPHRTTWPPPGACHIAMKSPRGQRGLQRHPPAHACWHAPPLCFSGPFNASGIFDFGGPGDRFSTIGHPGST